MSDVAERLTTLEMQFAVVAARLGVIDAQLALVVKQIKDVVRHMEPED